MRCRNTLSELGSKTCRNLENVPKSEATRRKEKVEGGGKEIDGEEGGEGNKQPGDVKSQRAVSTYTSGGKYPF